MRARRTGRRRFPAAALALGALLWAASGCGYTLEGTKRPEYLKDVHTIAIFTFVNHTDEPGLEITMTNAVRDRFLRDGRLRLAEAAEADLVLEGVIREYELEPIGFSRGDQVRRYRVFIRTAVRVRDVQRNKFILNQEIDSESEFDVSASIGQSDIDRVSTNSQAATTFSEELVSLVLEGF